MKTTRALAMAAMMVGWVSLGASGCTAEMDDGESIEAEEPLYETESGWTYECREIPYCASAYTHRLDYYGNKDVCDYNYNNNKYIALEGGPGYFGNDPVIQGCHSDETKIYQTGVDECCKWVYTPPPLTCNPKCPKGQAICVSGQCVWY